MKVEHCCQNEPVVVMEASLDEVMKVDAMMMNLLKSLTNDDVKLNDIPEANSEINSIEDVGETSNDEDGLKDDLEMKMGIDNDVVDDEIMTRRGLNYAKLIGDDHEAKSGGNRLKMRKSCNDWSMEQILNVLDQVRKRGFYDRIYLDHTIGCNGVEHAIFGNRIDMRLGLKH